ncbi:hypothetical protein N9I65_00725 [bacterium]|nr:hypothetical protein [bacterium]
MPDLTKESFIPHLGLSSIELSSGSDEGPLLPDDSGLDPIDASVESRLSAILDARNFERVMLDAIRPGIIDSTILKPGPFHALQREIAVKVEAARGDAAGGPDAQVELRDLSILLEKLGADHELGEHYRYALLKG